MINIFSSNLRPPKCGEAVITTGQWLLVVWSVNTDGEMGSITHSSVSTVPSNGV